MYRITAAEVAEIQSLYAQLKHFRFELAWLQHARDVRIIVKSRQHKKGDAYPTSHEHEINRSYPQNTAFTSDRVGKAVFKLYEDNYKAEIDKIIRRLNQLNAEIPAPLNPE